MSAITQFRYHSLYFFLSLLLLPNWVLSQKLVEEGKQWNIQLNDFTPEPSTFKLRIQGDTLIGNIIYKKILRTTDNANTGWFQLDQFLREDDNKKVFLKTGTDPEFVLYDFNLEKGDFIALSTICGMAVTDMDMVDLGDGISRRRLKMESSANPEDEGDFWIEGIGSTKAGLLTHFGMHCETDYGETLLCHYDGAGSLVFPDEASSCFVSSIHALSNQDQLKVFPNPVNNTLFIEDNSTENQLKEIRIFNVLGALVLQQSSANTLNEIDLSHLPKGAYFIILHTQSNLKFSQKLIKS